MLKKCTTKKMGQRGGTHLPKQDGCLLHVWNGWSDQVVLVSPHPVLRLPIPNRVGSRPICSSWTESAWSEQHGTILCVCMSPTAAFTRCVDYLMQATSAGLLTCPLYKFGCAFWPFNHLSNPFNHSFQSRKAFNAINQNSNQDMGGHVPISLCI